MATSARAKARRARPKTRKPRTKRNWMAGASKHPGAFRRKAKAAGMSTSAYARKVLKKGSRASTKTKRQASLSQTYARYRPHRRR